MTLSQMALASLTAFFEKNGDRNSFHSFIMFCDCCCKLLDVRLIAMYTCTLRFWCFTSFWTYDHLVSRCNHKIRTFSHITKEAVYGFIFDLASVFLSTLGRILIFSNNGKKNETLFSMNLLVHKQHRQCSKHEAWSIFILLCCDWFQCFLLRRSQFSTNDIQAHFLPMLSQYNLVSVFKNWRRCVIDLSC